MTVTADTILYMHHPYIEYNYYVTYNGILGMPADVCRGLRAAGNMIFLPKGASIIDVSPLNHEDKHAWAFFMAADYRVLRFNPIRIPLQRPVPMVHKLRAYRQWHQLSPEWRSAPRSS